jgi:hypothetical protein
MAWKHRVSNANFELMTVDCSNCGPNVKLHNYDRPRCWNGRQRGGTYGTVKLTFEEKMKMSG